MNRHEVVLNCLRSGSSFKKIGLHSDPDNHYLLSMDYLLAFAAQEFINFRELEVRSLLQINGLNQDCIPFNTNWTDPYVKVRLPNDQVAAALIERSMLVKCIYLIWASAPTFEDLILMVFLKPFS